MLETLGPFQKNVVVVACVLLIVAIAFIGWMLSDGESGSLWPPSVSNCPDYWEDSAGDGSSCMNVKRIGKCGNGPYNFTGWNAPSKACSAKGMMDKCNLTWDGITSIDPCAPSYEKRIKKLDPTLWK